MSGQKSRVCVIGAGPCGMSTLFQFDQLGDSSPEVVCYEKQDTWLGMWNFTWMTGTDEYGEPCHAGMYKNLWSNGPKEVLEFPYYTFDDHFKKATPSYPPRLVIRNYMEERLVHKSKVDLKRYIKWNTVVRQVRYHKETDNFTVTSEDLRSRHTFDETFTHVIVATGIFNVPNKPYFPGIETFSGRILHAHDFRDAAEFKDHRILVIGGSYSAEDIALQSLKYGAKSIVISYRSKPMNFKWPSGIEERPLVTEIHKNKIHFNDGTEAEVDSIVLCTGYKYQFTFMDDDLRLYSNLSLYPEGLYKGSVWMKNGNDKLFYIGVQDQYYTFTMFDVQAMWICKYISGMLPDEPKSREDMQQDLRKWVKRLESVKNCHDAIDFQTDFVRDLVEATGYDPNTTKADQLFHSWEHDKADDIVTYRDKMYKSIFTGTEGTKNKKWFDNFDDTVDSFVNGSN